MLCLRRVYFFLFLYSHRVSNEQAADGWAIMTAELSAIVDLFLMSFPIMKAIIPIRSYPWEPAVEQACAVQLLHSAA